MRSVSVRLADLENIKINLGYVGENEHVHILFDCKKAFDQYPNAVPSLTVVPPKGDSYPAVVTREGDIVEWVVTDSDLIYHGNGKIQLQFEQNDVVMKSAEARTFIAPSSIPTGTIPTPIQNWIAQANAILAEIPEDINSALAAAKASGEFDGDDGVGIASIAKTGTSGLVDTYTITLTNGSQYDIDVTNGTPGQNGVGIQNIAKTSTVGLVDTYTITLTNGQTYDFTVTNGEGGGAVIDDTTPAVDKVFSSSKVDTELGLVKNDIHGFDMKGELLSNSVKSAIINLFSHVVYVDDEAQTYIQALQQAWAIKGTLSSISADFEQGSAVIYEGSDLSAIKQYLTVTGTYTYQGDTIITEITDYTLSGSLTEGTCTITVTYQSKTTTFTVEVTSTFPSEYQKVEYIGASGGQGIIFDDIQEYNATLIEPYTYDIDCQFDEWNNASNSNIVAAFSSSPGQWFGYMHSIDKIAMGSSSGCYFDDNKKLERHSYHYAVLNGNGVITRDDGVSISRAIESGNKYKFALFGTSDYIISVPNDLGFNGKIYDFSISKNGTEIHHLVPCYRKSDDVIGFYDVITDTFYTNRGSGSFTKGGDL